MKLLVNGCSFTGGHDVIHNEDGILAPPPDYVWPTHCGEHVNLAIGGNSNDKIIRTTIETLEQDNSFDGVIVQFTGLYRQEQYLEQYNEWANLCSDVGVLPRTAETSEELKEQNPDKLFNIHFDKIEEDYEDKLNTLDKLLKTATDNFVWLKSEVDYTVEHLQNILLLQSILQDMDMPYLFTSMSMQGHPKYKQPHHYIEYDTAYENILASKIDITKWSKRPLTQMLSVREFDDTKHPNPKGHEMIATELMRDFRRANG